MHACIHSVIYWVWFLPPTYFHLYVSYTLCDVTTCFNTFPYIIIINLNIICYVLEYRQRRFSYQISMLVGCENHQSSMVGHSISNQNNNQNHKNSPCWYAYIWQICKLSETLFYVFLMTFISKVLFFVKNDEDFVFPFLQQNKLCQFLFINSGIV